MTCQSQGIPLLKPPCFMSHVPLNGSIIYILIIMCVWEGSVSVHLSYSGLFICGIARFREETDPGWWQVWICVCFSVWVCYPAHEVQQGGRNGRMRFHGVMHHQDGRFWHPGREKQQKFELFYFMCYWAAFVGMSGAPSLTLYLDFSSSVGASASFLVWQRAIFSLCNNF